jgi:hypothetical protein
LTISISTAVALATTGPTPIPVALATSVPLAATVAIAAIVASAATIPVALAVAISIPVAITLAAAVPIALSIPLASLSGDGRGDEAMGGIDRGERGSSKAQGHDTQPGGDQKNMPGRGPSASGAPRGGPLSHRHPDASPIATR